MPHSADLTKGQWRHKLKGCFDENPALVEAKFWDLEELSEVGWSPNPVCLVTL